MTPRLKKYGNKKRHNKALHRTAIPLRSIAAGELGRSVEDNKCLKIISRIIGAVSVGAVGIELKTKRLLL